MTSGRTRAIIGALVAVVVLGAIGVGVYVATRGGDTAVMLESAAKDGPDPFTTSVTAAEVPAPSEQVIEATAQLVSAGSSDDGTGTRVVPGTEPGLYGGTRDQSVCDAGALAAFLAEDDAKAAAWADVIGIDVGDIAATLDSYAPVVLTADTLVTNHGFSNGKATPRQSVLQAGTAVLVDDAGVPRVRCSCGNPLAPPAQESLADATVEGDEWDGYRAASVAVVAGADPTTALTVVDLRDGQRFEQPVGSSGATWIAVSGGYDPTGATLSGAIHTSPDGTTWSTALDSPAPLHGVAVSDDLAVVVGGSGSGTGGTVLTSTDGATWSEPIPVTDPLAAVAHGDGRWVAVGDRSFAEEGGAGDASNGAIWSSSDGTSWQRVATTSPYDNAELVALSGGILHQSMRSVAYGDGQWIASAQECTERVCRTVEFTSPDATNWTRRSLEGSLGPISVAHDGATWGLVGRDVTGIGAGADSSATPVAGTSSDGIEWRTGPSQPADVFLEGLSSGAGSWLAVQDSSSSPDVPGTEGVYRSSDLATWTELSTLDVDLHGVAVLAVAHTEPAAPAPTTTTVAAPATDAAGIRVLTRGLQFVDAQGMNTGLVPYSGPASAAIDTIRGAIGEPTVTDQAGDGTCVAESKVHAWGALKIVVPTAEPAGANWLVTLTGTPSELPAMPVTVAGDFTLGASTDEVASYFPGVPTLSFSDQGVTYRYFLLDPSGGDTEPGTLVSAQDGTVRSITAPSYLEDLC